MKYGLVFLFAGLLLFSSMAVADQDKGPEKIELDGGSRGKVLLPHRTHQNTLKDCNACHDVFPQRAGAIASLKAEGKLKNKHVMNKLCIACHKTEKKAGKPAGPITCADCHVR
ncbi:MAG: cytochrome c3 family protein [Pseudomonadota bacterium]